MLWEGDRQQAGVWQPHHPPTQGSRGALLSERAGWYREGAMPQPSKKERGFQTPLCKRGAGITRETIAMAMVEGLEKQLSPPEKKSTVLKRFCPRPVAKGPPATSECQRRARLAASPGPLLPWTATDVQPHAQTPTGHSVPMEGGDSSTPGSAQHPAAFPSCRLLSHVGPRGGGQPRGQPYLPVCVHSGEEDVRVLLGRGRAVRDRDIPPPPLAPVAPRSPRLTTPLTPQAPAPQGSAGCRATMPTRVHTHTCVLACTCNTFPHAHRHAEPAPRLSRACALTPAPTCARTCCAQTCTQCQHAHPAELPRKHPRPGTPPGAKAVTGLTSSASWPGSSGFSSVKRSSCSPAMVISCSSSPAPGRRRCQHPQGHASVPFAPLGAS